MSRKYLNIDLKQWWYYALSSTSPLRNFASYATMSPSLTSGSSFQQNNISCYGCHWGGQCRSQASFNKLCLPAMKAVSVLASSIRLRRGFSVGTDSSYAEHAWMTNYCLLWYFQVQQSGIMSDDTLIHIFWIRTVNNMWLFLFLCSMECTHMHT